MGASLDQFGRFARPAQQVLCILANGPRAPFVIRAEAGTRRGVDLGPGTLFGTLARLERHALIEVVPAAAVPRLYRLTALGAETLEAQLAAATLARPATSPAPNTSPAR
jgi:DNA-binding PadR family transcriptional regulator